MLNLGAWRMMVVHDACRIHGNVEMGRMHSKTVIVPVAER
jgi:hypothetical protein